MNGAARVDGLRGHFGWVGRAPAGTPPPCCSSRDSPAPASRTWPRPSPPATRLRWCARTRCARCSSLSPRTPAGESGAVYLACYALIERLLADGYTTVFDATNLTRAGRQRARATAARRGRRTLTLFTTAGQETVVRRLRRRTSGGSGRSLQMPTGAFTRSWPAPSSRPGKRRARWSTRPETSPPPSSGSTAFWRAPRVLPAFNARLDVAILARGSLLCVGLDPEVEKLPEALRGLPPEAADPGLQSRDHRRHRRARGGLQAQSGLLRGARPGRAGGPAPDAASDSPGDRRHRRRQAR